MCRQRFDLSRRKLTEYWAMPGLVRLFLVGVVVVVCVLAYEAGFIAHFVYLRERVSSGQEKPLAVFWEAWEHVEQNFYGPLPSSRERTYGAIREVLGTLGDPYTVFVPPAARELERDRLRGSYGDIGVELRHSQDGALLLYPLPDSPAARAGVVEGDGLVAVNGEPVTGTIGLDEVWARIRGEVGTVVTLTVSRPPLPPFDVFVVREEVQFPSVVWQIITGADGVVIGYLRIRVFTERTEGEVSAALRVLMQEEMKGLILDLRDNPGGLLDVAADVAGEFLESGVVLIEKSRDGERSVWVHGNGVATDILVIVLVNGGTASAAEVVAGAFQYHRRAILVGEPTCGKGSVQSVYELSDGSALHVTTAVWLTPDRRQIEGTGITPDVEISGDGEVDKQLEWAVVWFNSLPR